MNFKKTAIAAAMTASLGFGVVTTANAAIITADWSGLFTMLNSTGAPTANTSQPYYSDPTWGNGLRTQITGTMTFNTSTGAGSATVDPFDFFAGGPAVAHDITMQAIGGTLVAGKMLFDWNNNNNISVGIILDAAGFFGAGQVATSDTISGVGAIPASNAIKKGAYPIGPSPMATTAFDTDYNNDQSCVGTGTCTIVDGTGIGGDPMDNGPFIGFSANFDVTSMHITSVQGPVVPVPAAAWLLGSGLLGLVGVARRRKQS